MKTCFVSCPFGEKQEIDFDQVYVEFIRPAVENAGLQCVRSDELLGTLLKKEIFRATLGADVMIADVTTLNPNVFYMLGLRHMARRGVTLLIRAHGTMVPFDISGLRVLEYDVNELRQGESSEFKDRITYIIQRSLELIQNDSPLYEFFPDLSISLPQDVLSFGEQKLYYPQELRKKLDQTKSLPRDEAIEAISDLETVFRKTKDIDPVAFVDISHQYQAQGAWDQIISLSESLPNELSNDPQIAQTMALALNRRGKPGDRNRAVSVMKRVIDERGGTSEDFSILGGIYSRFYYENKQLQHLDNAIEAYLTAFKMDPLDYYAGLRAIIGMFESPRKTYKHRLKQLFPVVQELIWSKLEETPEDFWILSMGVELALLAGDQENAMALAEKLPKHSETKWMILTLMDQLKHYEPFLDTSQKSLLERLLNLFNSAFGKETSGAKL